MGRVAREREERGGPKVNGFIAVLESRIFWQDCLRRSMQSAFSLPILTCSTLSELELGLNAASAAIVIVSWMEARNEMSTNVLDALSELVPNVPVVVLAQTNDIDLARTAIRHGAKGYIPCTLGFDFTVEAVRFVLAGGTYVPMDCVLARGPGVLASPVPRPSGSVTAREAAVIRALQQGKPNKVIAYELNICESTVKVHVRNLMKKMKAKNRTDLAMKARQTQLTGGEQTSITLKKVLLLCVLTAALLAQAPQGKRLLPLDLLVRPALARQTSVKASHDASLPLNRHQPSASRT
jgi:DNA-binding NarL/FixJ family response regulator